MNKTYWRSLNELQDSPEFREMLHREFPVAASELSEGVSRRRWLQLMGASLALGGLTGCRWETELIAPLAVRPATRVPGVPRYFATAWEHAGFGQALLARNYDGRPIKVEGNPEHPASMGATTHFAQASILEFYDPDRLRRPLLRKRPAGVEGARTEGEPRTWKDFQDDVLPIFRRSADGGGVAVLAEPSSSVSRADMKRRFLEKFPRAKWYEYESISRDNEVFGAQLAFGEQLRPHYHLGRAKVVVCLDEDPFRAHPDSLRHQRDWSSRREPVKEEMGRLYVVETTFTVTGANADHRLALRPSQIAGFLALLEQYVERDAKSLEAELADAENAAAKIALAAAHDLVSRPGEGIVMIGPSQPAGLHARVHRINAKLGNLNKTVTFTEEPLARDKPYVEQLLDLVEAMNARAVGTLVILGGNPVYAAPADVAFREALSKVDHAIRLGLYDDETAECCEWALPMAHAYESWGDARTYDGTLTLIQPQTDPIVYERDSIDELIRRELLDSSLPAEQLRVLPWNDPSREEASSGDGKLAAAGVKIDAVRRRIVELLGGRSSIELLALLAEDDVQTGEGIVRRAVSRLIGEEEAAWRKALHDGFVLEERLPAATPTVRGEIERGAETLGEQGFEGGEVEVVFAPSSHTYDGRYANNSWLVETPDFITKLTWGNPVLMGVQTAKALGVEDSTLVRLSVGGRGPLEAPVYVLPGLAPGVAVLTLGFGRTAAGMVGGYKPVHIESVGVDFGRLRRKAALASDVGCKIEPLRRPAKLYSTQDHFLIDDIGFRETQRRAPELVRQATIGEYVERPDFAQHVVHLPPTGLASLWKERTSQGFKWGMAIDLNKCTGCTACVTACQAENNTPVVGAEQIYNSREMHWIRIDRYFRAPHRDELDDVDVVFQPMLCQQCDNAPCEQVCPVAATTHSDEGLNDMAYNRCIGTRYCANNCPYKVRRFNYFHFTGYLEKDENVLQRMVLNPDVTVRTRGVMEKCTWCVQRIQAAKIGAKNRRPPAPLGQAPEGRLTIPDGEIQTACEQACPTNAIVFGDLNDPESRVSRLHRTPRAYALLEELNVKPRNLYLARIRNPHPAFKVALLDGSHHGEEHGGSGDKARS